MSEKVITRIEHNGENIELEAGETYLTKDGKTFVSVFIRKEVKK